jgi:hypothetical protein
MRLRHGSDRHGDGARAQVATPGPVRGVAIRGPQPAGSRLGGDVHRNRRRPRAHVATREPAPAGSWPNGWHHVRCHVWLTGCRGHRHRLPGRGQAHRPGARVATPGRSVWGRVWGDGALTCRIAAKRRRTSVAIVTVIAPRARIATPFLMQDGRHRSGGIAHAINRPARSRPRVNAASVRR